MQCPRQVPHGYATWWCGDLYSPDLPTTTMCPIPDDVEDLLTSPTMACTIPDDELSRRMIKRIRAL